VLVGTLEPGTLGHSAAILLPTTHPSTQLTPTVNLVSLVRVTTGLSETRPTTKNSAILQSSTNAFPPTTVNFVNLPSTIYTAKLTARHQTSLRSTKTTAQLTTARVANQLTPTISSRPGKSLIY